MAETTTVAYRPLQLAQGYWGWLKSLLEADADPDELLAAVEEWTPFRRYLEDAALQDREATLTLAREIFAERARLGAQGIPIPEAWELFLADLGI
ncbi:hypothetical protein [Meiothermus cerbereus]|uniref:hypothetical protein n=1 Tax=Meiothermus cerbereus TaxID=65552 RepID=UPI0012EC8036|nr:hypothetical protein [Meiothermus cerbereus]